MIKAWMQGLALCGALLASSCAEKKEDDEASTLAGDESTTCRLNLGSFVMCTAYVDISAAFKAEMNSVCTDVLSATASDDPCPTEGVVGKCVVPASEEDKTPEYSNYFYPEYTTEAAQQGCTESGGTFSAS